MFNPLETRTFQYGVDADSALSNIEQGFSRMLHNCLIENGVDIVNIKGNLKATFEESFTEFDNFPNYTYKCLGSCYEPIKQKVYFFVKCTDNNGESPVKGSYIFEYDIASNIVYVVVNSGIDRILNFDYDELITNIFVAYIDGDTPLLYWTQLSGLRKINVYKAKLYYSSGGTDPDGYAELTDQTVARIKYPAPFAPEIKQITDTTFQGNNIQKGFFQFSTINIHDDYEKSVPSDWSRVNVPNVPYEVITNDVILFQENQRNNCIYITIKKPFETVKKVQILVRNKTSNVGTEINFDWRIYDTLIVSDITWDDNDEYTYKFYNDKIGELITQEKANQIFDNVPLYARAETFADNSRAYEGNITENYDLVDINAEITFEESTFTDVADASYIDLFVNQNIPEFGVNGGTAVLSNDPTVYEVGGTINFQFKVSSIPAINGDYNFQYVIKDGDLDQDTYPGLMLSNMDLAFNEYVPTELTDYLTFRYNPAGLTAFTFYVKDPYPPMGSPLGDEVISAYYKFQTSCVPQFKNRHTHYFGIGYADDGGRRSPVQKLEKVYYSADFETVLKGRVSIYNAPPSWATYYYIYYGGFDAGNFYQTKVTSIGELLDNNTRACTVDWLNTQYKFKDLTYLNYQYSVGDRIMFWYGGTDGNLGDFIDLAILGANDDSSIVYVENNEWLTNAIVGNAAFIVEIYKKSTFNGLYYTIDKGTINTLSNSHNGNIQDQDKFGSPELPAIQEFSGVNTYIRPRYMQDNFIQNVYLLNDVGTFIAGETNLGSTDFLTRVYIYKDAAKTQLIATFERSIPMTVPPPSYETQLNDELILYLNESTASCWTANDPSYTQYYFLNNFDCSVSSDLRITIAQRLSSSAPQVYFEAYSTGNNTTDSIVDNAVYFQNPSGTSEIKYIEDPNQSDLFVGISTGDGSSTSGSAVTSLGKPNIENINYRQVTRKNTVWYSGQFNSEANLNDLSSFLDGQFRDYEQQYGSIQKLHSNTTYLKVFMELKVGTIPINRYLSGGDGSNLVLQNSQILTRMEFYREDIGIGTHPESHTFYNGADYFVSPVKGSICRLSLDGITIISDVKNSQGNYVMRQYLYNLIKSNTGNFVATFNERRKSYEVNIGGCVVVWDENKNQWVGTRSYSGEMLGSAGVNMISFNNGILYLHESNPIYNNFYGKQYTSKIRVIGNNGLNNKIYKAIRTWSTNAWGAPFIANNKGQLSMLVPTNFKEREGKWYADFKMDMNTVNVSYPIINGKVLRDNVILVELENDSIEKEVLKYVELLQIPSN